MAGSYQGLKTFRSLSVLVTPLQVKGAAPPSSRGNIAGGWINNRAAAERFLKFYDSAAAPTVGGGSASTPLITVPLPANWVGPWSAIAPGSVYFANGIWVAATTGIADSDTGAPTANDVVVNLFYS